MKEDQKRSRRSAFAEGTFENIKVQWRSFLTFCVYFGFKFLPASLNTVCLYAQFLSRSFRSVESIKNYLSGVKLMHLLNDFEFSYLDNMSLKLTLRGLARLKPHLPKRAFPVTPLILEQIFEYLDMRNSFDVTLWSLFLIAFFTMSRKSNLVATSEKKFDANKQLCRGDVIIKNDFMIVVMKWSKTIQFGERKLRIPICSIPGSVLCPVKAYKMMINTIHAEAHDPAFCRRVNGKLLPITYTQFQSGFKNLISKIGRNPAFYSSHSFRRGGATFAFDSSVPTELIQLHGDWRSDAYKKYLEFSVEQKLLVSQKMTAKICS